MNKTKLNVCEKFDGAEEFINQKTEKICCQTKLSVEEVT